MKRGNGNRTRCHDQRFRLLGLYKKFAITEKQHLEFRAEAFDVNNHPNRCGVASFNPTSLVFGKVTSKTNLARNLQLSLRYSF